MTTWDERRQAELEDAQIWGPEGGTVERKGHKRRARARSGKCERDGVVYWCRWWYALDPEGMGPSTPLSPPLACGP